MKITHLIPFFCFCFIWMSSAEDIPDGLRVLLEKFTTDSTIRFGFQDLKNDNLIANSLKSQDIRPGIPIEVYTVDNDKQRDLPDSMEIKAFIQPMNKWEIPIYASGDCVCFVTAYCKNQSWELYMAECCAMSDRWKKVRKVWPENKGVDPIIIEWGSWKMLHFPKKNSHNLTYLQGWGISSDSADYDIAALGDSRRILPKLREFMKSSEKWTSEHPLPSDLPESMDGGNHEHQ